jgi:hypothetical protein
VDDAAKHIAAYDRTSSGPTRKWDRDSLTESLMWSTLVVELRIRGEHTQQMALVEDEHMV